MKKILVTGANGQLGSELRDLSSRYTDFQFIFLTREQLDISSKDSVDAVIAVHTPDYFINASAYTAVDLAEDEETKAFAVNADGAGYIAEACKKINCKLIHISTDYVFDGSSKRPYVEDDVVSPLGAYGRSKLAGEHACLDNDPDCIIIRTSWVYSVHGKNFVKTMKKLLTEREEIGVVADQYGCPTYAKDLAEAIMHIISCGVWKPGIYHFCNEGAITWFEFAREIKDLIGSKCNILPLTTEQYPVKATRPKFSVMNTDKIVASFNIHKKDWKSSLKACVERL
jgi:dTDP-4-dehydrorhamnose reductase